MGKIEEEIKEDSINEKLFARYATGLLEEKIPVPVPLTELVANSKALKRLEKDIEKQIQGIINSYDIYTKYLSHIQGIGPMFAANLIAMLNPIERFAKPSAVTAYGGFTGKHYEAQCEKGHKIIYAAVPKTGICNVRITTDEGKSFGEKREPCGAKLIDIKEVDGAPRRKAGYILMINSDLKTLMFKICSSFEKQSTEKSFYRKLYVDAKMNALAKLPEDEKGRKMHARLTAIRKVSSRFLIDLHVNWMYGLGYDVTPYQSTMVGHTMFPLKLDDGVPLPSKGSIAPIDEDHRYSIKQSVGFYYDIQKLRIAAFNNIVAWCKEHRDILPPLPPKSKDSEETENIEVE